MSACDMSVCFLCQCLYAIQSPASFVCIKVHVCMLFLERGSNRKFSFQFFLFAVNKSTVEANRLKMMHTKIRQLLIVYIVFKLFSNTCERLLWHTYARTHTSVYSNHSDKRRKTIIFEHNWLSNEMLFVWLVRIDLMWLASRTDYV